MTAAYMLPHQPVSPLRIGAFSTSLCLHLIAFGMIILPPSALQTPPRPATSEVIMADIIARVVSQPEPVPPMPVPPVRPTPKPRAAPTATTVPVILAESAFAIEATAVEVEHSETATSEAVAPAVSRAAQIAYDQASPPPYPGRAIRLGWEGTVMLRVRVDENGRPREVVIERSSGHVMLDRSASTHVLARWRFQPALRDGQPVQAWALVPVSFKLQGA